jgi:hypothetical protein
MRRRARLIRWILLEQLVRRRERLNAAVAHRLPRRLKQAAYIDVAVEALGIMPPHTVVPEVGMTEALDVWANGRVR